MDDNSVDIAGLDIAEVLLALYENTAVLGMGILQARDGVTLDDARDVLQNGSPDPGFSKPLDVDYMFGRPIKVRFDESGVINLEWYNRDAGDGVGQRVVAELFAANASHG